MAAFESGLSKNRHHEIFKKVIGTVILLPSESNGVIVNHEDQTGLRVSCIIKKTVRKAIAQWLGTDRFGNRWLPDPKEFELETPTLMYTTTYGVANGANPSLGLTSMVRRTPSGQQVALVALKEDTENQVLVKPYRIGNVYDAGNICWGGNDSPKNLREAHNLFWSSGINTDFGGPKHGRRCKNIEHVRNDHNIPIMMHRHEHAAPCQNSLHCIDANKSMLAILGPWNEDNRPIVRCLYCAGILQQRLSTSEAVRLVTFGSLCLCCVGQCSESSGCTCSCNCCRQNCACLCGCDLTDEHIELMRGYQEKLDRDVAWEDWTRSICGRKWNHENPGFFSYNGHCDGVFISYDKNFLTKIGKENVRKHYTWDAAIGLATMTKDGWEIDLGTKKINLGKHKVVTLCDMWESPAQVKKREDREYAIEQERLQREREETRVDRIRREAAEKLATEVRVQALKLKIENHEVSEVESAADLWLRFYANPNNSSWWQAPENLTQAVEIGQTWTS